MSRSPETYLIVVPVKFARSEDGRLAVEGAFCEHLRRLLASSSPPFRRLVVAAPSMAPAEYERQRECLGWIDEAGEGIRWVPLQPGGAGRVAFWLRHSLGVFRRLWREVRRADLVHAGTSHDLYRPIELAALLLARLNGKPTICVVDIDLRREATMRHRTGSLGLRSLLLCRLVYEPLRHLELRWAARRCSLVLLKGRRLWRDYARGRSQVKYFLDAAFSAEQVIPAELLASRAIALRDPGTPLELVYFGRLTAYKGVDRCIEAFARALALTRAPMRLCIIGAGEEAESLQRLASELGVRELVEFQGALPYGPRLFEQLYARHLLLAAPLSEDTPRSALDALACGLPILAFATDYYSDLEESGAVALVPWPSVELLAERIARYAEDKRWLIPMARAGVEFARENTQEAWLRARAAWTSELFGAPAVRGRRRRPNKAWQRTGTT